MVGQQTARYETYDGYKRSWNTAARMSERIRSGSGVLRKENRESASWTMSSADSLGLSISSATAAAGTDSVSHPLTSKDIRDLIDRALSNKAIVIDYSLRSYSEGKLGYLASHQRLCVTVKNGDEESTLGFFVKTVPYEIASQADYVIKRGVFAHEATFYKELVPELCKIYRGEPWAPICYVVKEDVMIFEDLINKGFSMRGKLFDKESIEEGLATLARLHAASLLAEERLGDCLNAIYPHAFKERCLRRTGRTREWFEAGVRAAIGVARSMDLDTTSIPDIYEEAYNYVKPSTTKRNVISHGDLWANNLMFTSESPAKCVLVDFQLVRYCPPGHDIAQFLHLCASRSYRDTRQASAIKHYYRVFSDTLDGHDYGPAKPSLAEVARSVEEQRLGAVIFATLYFPSVLLDASLCAEIINDSERYSEFIFRDRTETVLKNFQTDQEYGERIREAVTELVELAARFDELPKPS